MIDSPDKKRHDYHIIQYQQLSETYLKSESKLGNLDWCGRRDFNYALNVSMHTSLS